MTEPRRRDSSVAAVIARFLKVRGVERVFGLCGGHIMPIWMRLDWEGLSIVDVRDERAAVHDEKISGHSEFCSTLLNPTPVLPMPSPGCLLLWAISLIARK